jgi:glutaminase
MNLELLVAGKSKAQITAMADNLETIADAMAPLKGAGAKATAGKAITAKTVAAKTVATKTAGATVGKTALGVSAKSGSASSVLACCTKGLGLGIGLGPWGPLLLAAGGATAGWYVYKKYFRTDIDAPTI